MERRDFLATGAATLAGGAAGTAHAAIQPGLDLGNFVERLDRTLDALTSATLCDLTPPDGEADRWSRYDVLCRKALRSLHLASTFHDLPRDAQRDERIQHRMWAALPEMDDAVFDMADALEEIGPAGMRELRDAFLTDAELRANVMERFYSGIEAAEITDERMERSRSLMRQVKRELGREKASGMVEQVIADVQRLRAVRYDGVAAWNRVYANTDEPPVENGREPGWLAFRCGGWSMGIGLVGGGGLAIAGHLTSDCGMLCAGIGIGALLLVVGLGFLLVGAIRRARARRVIDPAER